MYLQYFLFKFQTKFLPENSNTGKYLSWRNSQFSTQGESDNLIKVLLIWGLKKQDISRCHKTDPACFGDTVWDDNFNLDSAEAQNALLVG